MLYICAIERRIQWGCICCLVYLERVDNPVTHHPFEFHQADIESRATNTLLQSVWLLLLNSFLWYINTTVDFAVGLNFSFLSMLIILLLNTSWGLVTLNMWIWEAVLLSWHDKLLWFQNWRISCLCNCWVITCLNFTLCISGRASRLPAPATTQCSTTELLLERT